MKVEPEGVPGVDTDRVDEVMLTDQHWYSVADNSFRLYSAVPAEERRRVGSAGAYLRFRCADTGKWIEAPLGSLVAVSYPDSDEQGVG